ncbi:MAG: pseudouridine synthase [Bacilli bacterium]|nr:pseudouridine synthase [Bacilli bacterium]
MRINVYISSTGLCSRREADRMIVQGRVKLNGVLATTGMDVSENDTVEVDGKRLMNRGDDDVYILLNKPRGIISTTETAKKDNMVDYVGYPKRIFPVGRLDKDTSGLIILTSDGNIVNRILRSENNHEKEYRVQVDKPVSEDFLKQMVEGVVIYNPAKHRHEKTMPADVKRNSKNTFTIILTQGLNLQIRRMTKALGFNVTKLERIRIMNLTDKGLPLGKWRLLSETELSQMFEMLDNKE